MTHDVLKEALALRRSGKIEQACSVVRIGLQSGKIPPKKMEMTGRFLEQTFQELNLPLTPLRVLLVSQFTTAWLSRCLVAAAFAAGTTLQVKEAPYDTMLWTLAQGVSDVDVVVVAPWTQQLSAAGERSPDERVNEEILLYQSLWELVSRGGSQLVHIGYDGKGPNSNQHLAEVAQRLNERVTEKLPPDAYLLELQRVSKESAPLSIYDSRQYEVAKQPFSPLGLARVASHLWAGIRAVTTGPKKVLVVDLDNTLWEGLAGEMGASVQVSDCFVYFQKYLRQLSQNGVLLAISSKNNIADAKEVFEKNPQMLLSLSDFAATVINWEPKSLSIIRIAKTLNLGLDSFVFFDDSPAERHEVRMALPQVEAVEVPPSPSQYVQALEEGLYFESVAILESDRTRHEQYQAESRRQQARSTQETLEGYLVSLQMVGRPGLVHSQNLPRIRQLLARTNQFNLTNRRHSSSALDEILSRDGAFGLTLELSDRFGDYGLISVVLATPHDPSPKRVLKIDTWLMSCRAIGRSVEEKMLQLLVSEARERGFESLLGEYVPSAKNAMVAELYPRLGFQPLQGGDTVFRLHLEGFQTPCSFVAAP